MMIRQSTEITVLIGPFVDKTDGVTAEEGLEAAGSLIDKNGAGFGAGPALGTMDATLDGWYPITLTTTHTNTLGRLVVVVQDPATHLPVWREYNVVEEQVWDSLMSSDVLQVHAVEMSNDLITANVLQDDAITASKLAGDCITTTQFADGTITAAKIAADAIAAAKIAADAGAEIAAAVWAAATRTITGLTAAALKDFFDTDSGDTYATAAAGSVVKEIADNAGGSSLTVGDIADAVWDEDITTHTTADSAGEALGAAGSGADAATIADAVLDEALSGHTDAGSLGKAVADIESDATAILADTNELQADDTPAALAAIDAKIDVIDGIADAVLLDTAEIGAAGAGLTAVPWNAAWDAEVQSEAADALTAYDPPTKDELDTAQAAIIADTEDLQARLPAALTAGGNIKADVVAISGDATAADNLESYCDGTTPQPVNVTQISGDGTSADNLELYTDGTTPAPVNAVQISGSATAADNLESYCDGTDNQPVDVKEIDSSSPAAANLGKSALAILPGTVSHDNTPASTTVFYSDDITEATADHFIGRIVIFTSGALQYQATDITDYALDTGEGKFTVTALTEAPADNVTFIIL